MLNSPKAKMWVAVIGALAMAIAQTLPQYAPYASVVIALLVALGVYEVPNAKDDDPVAEEYLALLDELPK